MAPGAAGSFKCGWVGLRTHPAHGTAQLCGLAELGHPGSLWALDLACIRVQEFIARSIVSDSSPLVSARRRRPQWQAVVNQTTRQRPPLQDPGCIRKQQATGGSSIRRRRQAPARPLLTGRDHDVGAAKELAVDVDLGEGRPLAEVLHACMHACMHAAAAAARVGCRGPLRQATCSAMCSADQPDASAAHPTHRSHLPGEIHPHPP